MTTRKRHGIRVMVTVVQARDILWYCSTGTAGLSVTGAKAPL
jgi:hypothetical protein